MKSFKLTRKYFSGYNLQKSIYFSILLLLLCTFVSAQQVIITGKVVVGDSALADVTVSVRNSTIFPIQQELWLQDHH